MLVSEIFFIEAICSIAICCICEAIYAITPEKLIWLKLSKAVLPDGVVWHQIGVISQLVVSKFFNGVLVSNLNFWCPKFYVLKLWKLFCPARKI